MLLPPFPLQYPRSLLLLLLVGADFGLICLPWFCARGRRLRPMGVEGVWGVRRLRDGLLALLEVGCCGLLGALVCNSWLPRCNLGGFPSHLQEQRERKGGRRGAGSNATTREAGSRGWQTWSRVGVAAVPATCQPEKFQTWPSRYTGAEPNRWVQERGCTYMVMERSNSRV